MSTPSCFMTRRVSVLLRVPLYNFLTFSFLSFFALFMRLHILFVPKNFLPCGHKTLKRPIWLNDAVDQAN